MITATTPDRRPRRPWIFASALLAATAAGCSGDDFPEWEAFQNPGDAPPAIAQAAKAVVRISTAGSSATGSFISNDGLLMTNNHVLGVEVCPIEGCFATLRFSYEIGTTVSDPTVVRVKPLHVDPGLDLAVVQVFSTAAGAGAETKLQTSNFLTFSARSAADLEGEHVYVVGHPEGRLKKVTEGDVFLTGDSWFETTAPSLPGNSGSPVLDASGAVVGLLHRGPRSVDLVSAEGENLYSVCSASAPLVDAMKADLPPSMWSLAADTTAEDVVLRQTIYRNAKAATAMVGGETRDVVDLLAQACDAGLSRTDFVSLEDLYDALGPCSDAMNFWISCATTPEDGFPACPAGASRDAWRARLTGLNDRMRQFNGELWLDAVSFGLESLEETEDAGLAAGQDGLAAALAEADRPLDFSVAPYLAAYKVETYDGESVASFIKGYAGVPDYPQSAADIVYAATWLAYRGALDQGGLTALLEDLAEDPAVSLGDRLLIEDVRYRWKLLSGGE